MLLLQK